MSSPSAQRPQDPMDLQVDTAGQAAPAAGQDVDPHTMQVLTRLLRVAYPHAVLSDGPYQRTAETVRSSLSDDEAANRAVLAGLESLERAAGGDFLALEDAAAEQLLRDRADDDFFRRIRSTAVVALYDDSETWTALGYEGASFDRGGYLHRGFDDLDWLPAPRIEEYDGEGRIETVDDEGAAR